jgi:DNA (cytosine-5)-methyltransferase 1
MGELFCGPGGLAYGAVTARCKNTDFEIVHEWATDYDKDTCDTYIYNICKDTPESVIHEDIRKLDLQKLKPIDALAFGFPCNDYSVVGEQKGIDGQFGPLYTYGIKVLKLCQPQWFLAENVGGLKNADGGKTFNKIIKEMCTSGYTVPL